MFMSEKPGDKEIDFVCERQGEKIYIQCAYLLIDDQTIEREFGNLLMIRDNYPKYVVTMDDFKGNTNQGIIHSNLREFCKGLVNYTSPPISLPILAICLWDFQTEGNNTDKSSLGLK